jgi:hypothetical protein
MLYGSSIYIWICLSAVVSSISSCIWKISLCFRRCMGLLELAEAFLGSQPPVRSVCPTNYIGLYVNGEGLKSRKEPISVKLECEILDSPVGIMKIIIFRNMTPCSLINKYGSFLPSFRTWPFLNRESHLHPKDGSWLHCKSACTYLHNFTVSWCKDSNFSILGYWVLKTNWNNSWGLITLAFWVGI